MDYTIEQLKDNLAQAKAMLAMVEACNEGELRIMFEAGRVQHYQDMLDEAEGNNASQR